MCMGRDVRGLWIAVLALVVAVSAGNCRGEAAEDTEAALMAKLKCGFRYDPMKWVETNKSVGAARLRTLVFKKPQPGDSAILKKEIDRILARQKEDGSFGENTCGPLTKAIELGCALDRPEVKRAVDYLVKHKLDEDGTLGIYRLRALCLSGDHHAEIRDKSLRELAERCKEGIRLGCPWTPEVHLKTLWAGRKFMDVRDAMKTDLEWIANGMNEVGSLSHKDPWGFLDLAGTIDHPLGKKIMLKLVPMLLRIQRPDGGWSDSTFRVLSALARHGLLEPLRKLPPLPSDWTIVRSIPAPVPRLSLMAWGGDRLWLLSSRTNEALAVSTDDGEVLSRIKLPDGNIQGIARWGKSLALTLRKPSRVCIIDPNTGKTQQEIPLEGSDAAPSGITQVGDQLWVADVWNGAALIVDPAKADQKPWRWAFPSASWLGYADLAAADDGLWHAYIGTIRFCSAPLLAKSELPTEWYHDWKKLPDVPNSRVLEWGERPFDGQCAGLAWDGKGLWAQHREQNRICLIQKADPAKPHYDWLKHAVHVEAAAHVSRGTFRATTARIEVANASVRDARLTLRFPPTATYTVDPKRVEVAVPASSTRSVEVRLVPTGQAAEERPPMVVSYRTASGPDGKCAYEGKSSHELLPRIAVPRLGKLKGLDAVRDALRGLAPETVRAGDRVVGELRLGVAGEFLACHLRSHDPRCRADAPEWEGCNVDVYVATPGSRTVRQFVFFATSPKGEGRVEPYELGKKRETADFPWRVVPIKPFGYEVHALIPRSECLIGPDADEFLVDMAVVAPPKPGEKPQFTLLFTGEVTRWAYRNNRYYALAAVEEGD